MWALIWLRTSGFDWMILKGTATLMTNIGIRYPSRLGTTKSCLKSYRTIERQAIKQTIAMTLMSPFARSTFDLILLYFNTAVVVFVAVADLSIFFIFSFLYCSVVPKRTCIKRLNTVITVKILEEKYVVIMKLSVFFRMFSYLLIVSLDSL